MRTKVLLKNNIFLLIFLILFLSIGYVAHAKEIEHEISLSKAYLSFNTLDDYDVVKLRGSLLTSEPGAPQVPLKVLHFVLDRGKCVSGIEILSDTKEILPGEFNIYPAQKSVRISDTPEFTPPDPAYYDSSDSYPGKIVEIKNEGLLSGVNIVTVHVYPLEYVPLDKKLILHTNIRFRIVQKDVQAANVAFISAINTINNLAGNSSVKNMINKLVSNPEDFKEQLAEVQNTIGFCSVTSFTKIDYLIVTSESLKQSGVFQPLIDSKTARGLSCMIESVENIEATISGRDTQEKIRNYIKNLHDNNGLVWCLLGGDTDIIPARHAEVDVDEDGDHMHASIPCDMYYGNLDGSWDADGDNAFGEPEDDVDYLADVFIGRAPVEDETEAQVFVNKILTYESNVVIYAKKALFLGTEDFDDVGGIIKDFIDEEYMPEEFKPITKLYQRDLGGFRDEAIEAINEGYNIINHIDHADINVMKAGSDDLWTADIDSLMNASMPAVMCSCGCWPAAIDYDCIAEHWITNPDGGGVAFVGNSRYGWHPESSEGLDPEFFYSVFKESFTRIGEALADSKTNFVGVAQTSSKMRYAIFELNLLGDPEMQINFYSSGRLSIRSPRSSSFVRGSVNIEGSAYLRENFDRYELCYAPFDDPENVTTFYTSGIPVEEGLLGIWDTTLCSDGEYILILKLITSENTEIAASIKLMVDNVNDPPLLELSDQAVGIDRLLEFEVTAIDPDDPDTPEGELYYQALDLPPTATFDPDTRMFSWKPEEYEKGMYEVTFIVDDSEHRATCTIVLSTVFIEEIQIAQLDSGSETGGNPQIYEDKIVWNDSEDIYLYNISTGAEIQISDDILTFPRFGVASIYEDKIVWCKYDSSDLDIFMYDLDKNQKIAISSKPGDQFSPTIFGDNVVFRYDYGIDGAGIAVYNISSGEEKKIVDEDICYSSLPDIYENRIVWSSKKHGSDNPAIYMYDISTEEEMRITNDYGCEYISCNAIYGDKIVWSEYRDGIRQVCMYDILTWEKTHMAGDRTVDCYDPAIHKDTVVWLEEKIADNPLFTYYPDLYMYDIPTGKKIQITNRLPSDPSIFENMIVWKWTEPRYGQRGISLSIVYFIPHIASVDISKASPGQKITIKGDNFGYLQRDSQVMFANGAVAAVESWSNTEIVCIVPEDAQSGEVKVVTKGGESNGIEVIVVPKPEITYISPQKGKAGSYLYITGKNFGSKTASCRVEFADSAVGEDAYIYYWYDTYIGCRIPELERGEYAVTVINDAGRSNSITFEVVEPPTAHINWIYPNTPYVGEYVYFYGYGTTPDPDATIASYYWYSTIDGYIGSSYYFYRNDLSAGEHTIRLYVRDSNGIWSSPATKVLTIKEKIPETEYKRGDLDRSGIVDYGDMYALYQAINGEAKPAIFDYVEPKGVVDYTDSYEVYRRYSRGETNRNYDVNWDGKIDYYDYRDHYYYVYYNRLPLRLDFNGDGVVDMNDMDALFELLYK